MNCSCADTVDEKLKGHNTRLSRGLNFQAPESLLLFIRTEQIETGRGKEKAISLFASYCPFCGLKLNGDRS